MRIIIQKFGGTSVAKPENREMTVQKIIAAQKSGYKTVVVVSAMGRKGEPYATDTLIEFLQAVYENTHPRDMDIAMSMGEIMSSVVIANTLRSKGYDSIALTGWQAGIITDTNFGNAEILDVKPSFLLNALEQGKIPVVAGFQGAAKTGEITTLGRGGSDITAVTLGEALNAELIEIYTDVDGIMTADPRIVSNAVTISHISYTEIFQIADQGARVIHPKAVEIAMRSGIPVLIKNSMTDSPGTIISTPAVRKQDIQIYRPERVITSVAHVTGRTQISIDTKRGIEEQNEVLHCLADNNISIDIINIFPEKMIFTIEGNITDKALQVLNVVAKPSRVLMNCSKISAVGERMRGVPGVMSRIILAMRSKQIEVLQTSDSHSTISCLVKGEDTVPAVLALHEEFKLYQQ
ncbi:MAG: aspartate kinase [Clostridia bacterium]|nr:aspartate kinase [Clostridia bacterium]MDD4679927.1 aspartate kinase [Clostridia bacterium]